MFTGHNSKQFVASSAGYVSKILKLPWTRIFSPPHTPASMFTDSPCPLKKKLVIVVISQLYFSNESRPQRGLENTYIIYKKKQPQCSKTLSWFYHTLPAECSRALPCCECTTCSTTSQRCVTAFRACDSQRRTPKSLSCSWTQFKTTWRVIMQDVT